MIVTNLAKSWNPETEMRENIFSGVSSLKFPEVTDLVASSAGASCPVDIVLIVVGAAVIDHQDQLLDVQASGCHRGGHHQATYSILKIVDDAVSVILIDP